MDDRDNIPVIRDFIFDLADRCIVFGGQAGVGSMETAGSIISYLANNPDDIEPFLNGGIGELPMLWHEKGCLTWHARDGRIVTPQYVRRARVIKSLGDPEPPA